MSLYNHSLFYEQKLLTSSDWNSGIRSLLFYKIGVLKNFAEFTWKQLRSVTLIKKSRCRCFPVNFAKFLRIKFYIKINFFELSVTLGRGENKYYTQTTANTFTKSNNTWNNFKLKMKEKRLLQFITTFFTFIFHHSIIISIWEYPYRFHSWILRDFSNVWIY